MARRKKSKIKIPAFIKGRENTEEISSAGINDVSNVNSYQLNEMLPPFQGFIDIVITGAKAPNLRKDTKKNARIFYSEPDIKNEKEAIFHGMKIYGSRSTKSKNFRREKETCLFESILEVSDDKFAKQVVRVHMNYICNLKKSDSVVSKSIQYFKEFIIFIALSGIRSIWDIERENFHDYKYYIQKKYKDVDQKIIRERFNKPKEVLNASYSKEKVDELNRIKAPKPITTSKIKPNITHKAAYIPKEYGYSDEVMYQLLAILLREWNHHVELRETYLSINSKNMILFLDPALNNVRWGREPLKAASRPSGAYQKDVIEVLNRPDYMQILYENALYYMKAGILEAPSHRIRKYVYANNPYFNKVVPNATQLIDEYNDWLRNKLGGISYFVPAHIKLPSNGNMRSRVGSKLLYRVTFILVYLVMIYTGLNREVVLSWPSMNKGESILKGYSDLFISKHQDNDKKEIEIKGIKSKTGIADKKEIPVTIDVNSPLYKMLEKYEDLYKIDFEGPFFEVIKSKSRPPLAFWKTRGYEIREHDDTSELGYRIVENPWDTSKLRKVFASGKMIEALENVKTAQELMDTMQEALVHNNFDVTLSNYLMKTEKINSVIDIAITTITSQKLQDGLKFKGQVGGNDSKRTGKKVFLCDCSDPKSPTHDLNIAEECTHYDMCLGCKRSTIFKIHLPYICARILQYESFRESMGSTWQAMFSDKFIIANDALSRFTETYQDGGKAVAEAWDRAKDISLPPILQRV